MSKPKKKARKSKSLRPPELEKKPVYTTVMAPRLFRERPVEGKIVKSACLPLLEC